MAFSKCCIYFRVKESVKIRLIFLCYVLLLCYEDGSNSLLRIANSLIFALSIQHGTRHSVVQSDIISSSHSLGTCVVPEQV
jgi:hypothetical protein